MKKFLRSILNSAGVDLVRYDNNQKLFLNLHERFRDYTMIPAKTFAVNLDIINEFKNADGDYVECGVWKGGMSAAAAVVLSENKKIHLFDSFEGLPEAKEIDGEAAINYQKNKNADDYFDNCSAEERFVMDAMKIANHSNYRMYKGWFKDTLPGIQTKKIGILRIDGDWYDSVMDCLEALYPLVVKDGVIIIDDYFTWDGCSRAVHDFLSKHKLPLRIRQRNNLVAYITV